MAALPALGLAESRYVTIERLNVLITEYNAERSPVPVGSLPNANLYAGFRRIVTDATVTTFGSVVTGGGANVVPVYADTTGHWRIG